MAVVIAKEEIRNFEFTIEGAKKVHRIPLAAYLPYPFMRRMLTVDSDQSFAMALIHEFCPELEDDQKITFGTISDIYAAWQDASSKDGLSVGESSPSPEQ